MDVRIPINEPETPAAKDGTMRTPSAILAAFIMSGLISPSLASASKIMLLSSGDASNDVAIQAILQSEGDSVTIGPTYNNFTGTGLIGYNAVFLNPTNMGGNAPDMPLAGKQALIGFVMQGGGLVAGGGVSSVWTYPGDFRVLGTALPGAPGQAMTNNSPITFTSQTSDPIINAGLRPTFSFPASGISEQFITPKAGATSFFATNQWTATFGGYGPGAGSVGWNLGGGRVLSLSTFSDNVALSSPAYDRMLANSLSWAAQLSAGIYSPPVPTLGVPEPTGAAVFALAGLGLWIASFARRKLGRQPAPKRKVSTVFRGGCGHGTSLAGHSPMAWTSA
jgi:hypothetical protein